jgi:hypothetical protein
MKQAEILSLRDALSVLSPVRIRQVIAGLSHIKPARFREPRSIILKLR